MTSAASNLKASPKVSKIHCDLDDWDFDPRYTGGACPICGWTPPGAIRGKTALMSRLERIPLDYIALGLLGFVLVVLGVMVLIAAGVSLAPKI